MLEITSTKQSTDGQTCDAQTSKHEASTNWTPHTGKQFDRAAMVKALAALIEADLLTYPRAP